MQTRDNVLVPTSDIMQPLYASTNLSSTFANLARSLSVAIRNSAPLDTAQRGTSYRNFIYFRIRWGWFIIPLTTTVAGCIFVAACIWQTRMQNVAAWKTSSLATLVHGLDEKTRAEVRSAGAVGVSKGVATVKISLRDAPDGSSYKASNEHDDRRVVRSRSALGGAWSCQTSGALPLCHCPDVRVMAHGVPCRVVNRRKRA